MNKYSDLMVAKFKYKSIFFNKKEIINIFLKNDKKKFNTKISLFRIFS